MSQILVELLNTYNNKQKENNEIFDLIVDNIFNLTVKISDFEEKLLSIESNVEKMLVPLNELKKIMLD